MGWKYLGLIMEEEYETKGQHFRFYIHIAIYIYISYTNGDFHLLWTVNYDAFTPALWKLLLVSLTVVLGFFITALTIFLSSTAVVFLGLPVRHLLLSTPVTPLFLGHSKQLYWLWPILVQWLWLIVLLLSALQLFFTHTQYKCTVWTGKTQIFWPVYQLQR